MSSRTKTQKRNAQRKKQRNPSSPAEASKHSHQVSELSKQVKELTANLVASQRKTDAAMKVLNKVTGADKKDVKTDETHFAPPTEAQLATDKLAQLSKIVDTALDAKADKFVQQNALIVARNQLTESVRAIQKELSKPPPAPMLSGVALSEARHRLMSRGGRHHTVQKNEPGYLNTFHTRIGSESSVNSAANTALTTTIAIDPGVSTEYSNFVSLFDEIKVTGGVFHFFMNSTGGTPVGNHGSMAYDPADSGGYTTDVEPLLASQHFGPFTFIPNGPAAATANIMWGPQSRDKMGMWSFKFKCPNGPQRDANNSANSTRLSTGMWADLNSSASPWYGFIKPYIPAAGTSVVCSINYWLILDVMVRSRT